MFLAEAKRLWELEADSPRITTIQAAILLDLTHIISGVDKIGRAYSVRAVAMAKGLGLFDSTIVVRSQRTAAARAFTAWMIYHYER